MKKNGIWRLLAILLVLGFFGCDNLNEDCTVTFNLEGGNIDDNTSPVSRTVKSGETIALELFPKPKKLGYSLSGWITGSGGTFDEEFIVTSNLTVYAKWTAITAGNFPPYELTGIQAIYGNNDTNSNHTKNFLLSYQGGDVPIPLSNLIENPSVRLINGKVSVYFDKPKNWNPQSGKIFGIGLNFVENNVNNRNILGYGRYGVNSAPGGSVSLLYTEEAITLTKDKLPEMFNMLYDYWSTVNINLNLNPGWNLMFTSYEELGTVVNVTDTEPDDNFNWYLYENVNN